MLSHEAILRLHQDLGHRKVLSLYLNAGETNPAERRAWRLRLSGMLKQLDAELGTRDSDEQEAARSALALLEAELARYPGLLPERGWVGFASADRVWHAGPTPAPLPDLVRWEQGVHVAPYVRALKQSRPVTTVVADQRHARIYGYLHGELREDQVLWADSVIADSSSAGASKRASTHSGMRGEPRGDTARRISEVATQRMVREVLTKLPERVGEEGLLVITGTSETMSTILRALPDRLRTRAIDVPGVHTDASDAELREVVEAAASELSARLQKDVVDEVIEATRSAGRACLGRERTERALRMGAVDTLVLSRAFTRAHPDLTERLVDLTLDHGARVEEVAEAAAESLDREGGVGARLRYLV
jgi:peptide subunit release factor 1 (eRF1)